MLIYDGDERIAEADIWFANAHLSIIKSVLVRSKDGEIEARAHVRYDGVLWMHVRELDNVSDEQSQRWARDGFATTTPHAAQLPASVSRALRNATRVMASLVGAVDYQLADDHPLHNDSNS